jgi:hypothetical protein
MFPDEGLVNRRAGKNRRKSNRDFDLGGLRCGTEISVESGNGRLETAISIQSRKQVSPASAGKAARQHTEHDNVRWGEVKLTRNDQVWA